VVWIGFSSWFFHELVWVLTNGPYLYWEKTQPAWLQKYKIQRYRTPWPKVRALAVKLFLHHFTVVLPLGLLYGALAKDFVSVEWKHFPSLPFLALQVAVGAGVRDLMMFFIHRWLHTPWAYENIHKVHHENFAPFSVAGEHVHFLETLMAAVFPMVAGLFCAHQLSDPYPTHIFLSWIILFHEQFRDVEGHCGYNLPFHFYTSWFMNWYDGGAVHHDAHHSLYYCNYSARWLDRLMGTDEHQWRKKMGLRAAGEVVVNTTVFNGASDAPPDFDATRHDTRARTVNTTNNASAPVAAA